MMGLRVFVVLLPTLLFGVVNGDCGFGIPGILDGDTCCAAECGSCGGSGCSHRPGGEDSCCATAIRRAGVPCSSTGAGPCMMAASSEPTCSNGLPGIQSRGVCCPVACGRCGGIGCSQSGGGKSEGLGEKFCCTSDILGGGKACSDSVSAPCIVGPSPPSPSPSPNPSPTPIMTIPNSCKLSTPEFSFDEADGVDGRMYAHGDGCFTMTDLYNFRGEWSDGKSKGPVYVLDDNGYVDEYPDRFTGKWLLTSDLFVTGGGTFYCRGADIGGDCDELRIESRGSNAYHEVRGHGGNLYFESTLVTSWDTPNRKPQTEHKNGRSFLNCISERRIGTTCAINEMGECRMDIINSEMGHMGFDDAESYGLTWKVRGFCTDLSNPQLFDDVNVYGDIKGSDIHHMYYGMYSYGHQGGVWTDNKMHDNIVYGFDPHDDSDYLTIAYNEVYNNANHCIIASKRCNNLKIHDNVVHDGGQAGIFLHRSGDDSEIYGNVITDMEDAGIVLFESFGNDVHHNIVDGSEFGIRLVLGSAYNLVHDNGFNAIADAAIFTYFGSDPPEIDDGRPFSNEFYDNEITNTALGVKLKDCDDITIRGNTFTGTELIEFNDAHDTVWSGNTLPSGVCLLNRDDSSSFVHSSGLPGDC
eukprot:g12081.t1